MKVASTVFLVAGLLTGLWAAWRWYVASSVRLPKTLTVDLPSGPHLTLDSLVQTHASIVETSNLNRSAALWTAVSVFMNTLASVATLAILVSIIVMPAKAESALEVQSWCKYVDNVQLQPDGSFRPPATFNSGFCWAAAPNPEPARITALSLCARTRKGIRHGMCHEPGRVVMSVSRFEPQVIHNDVD